MKKRGGKAVKNWEADYYTVRHLGSSQLFSQKLRRYKQNLEVNAPVQCFADGIRLFYLGQHLDQVTI